MAIDLTDVQGNVVTGYPAELGHGRFTYLKVPPGGETGVGKFLAAIANRVTPASDEAPQATLNVGIAYPGLLALGLPRNSLESFPNAFRQGMQQRAPLLGDDVEGWDDVWKQDEPVAMLVSIHGTDDAINGLHSKFRDLANDAGLTAIEETPAGRLPDGREHFGFVDGISNPTVAGTPGEDEPGGGKWIYDHWEPLAPGEFLLGHRDEADHEPSVSPDILGRNGSFLVYRKLYQKVDCFRKAVDSRAKDGEDVASKIVGRRPDGVPLAKDAMDINDFHFAGDTGAGCPMGSHIRRVHPRAGDPPEESIWDRLRRRLFNKVRPDLSARHRIIRRGIPYGPRLPPGEEEDDRDRGLLFLALNTDIERQFEFIQARYVEDGEASQQGFDKDPLIGDNAEKGSMVIPGDEGKPPRILQELPTFVEMKGGDYFFVPSLNAIRWLAAGQWEAGAG